MVSVHCKAFPLFLTSFIDSAPAATCRRFLYWLIPSPFRSTSNTSSPSNKIAALDGLRGFACFAVLNGHWALAVDDLSYNVAGLSHGLMWKPFIFLLWDGTASVTIFFAISGYVLSYSPLRKLHAHHPDTYKSIASSIFRRALRLFLPTMAVIFLLAILAQLGVFGPACRIHWELNGLAREAPPPVAPSFLSQMMSALWECYCLIATSTPGVDIEADMFSYDKHVWTLPVEFKSSMVLFILLMGTSILTSGWRLCCHTFFLLYCLYTDNHNPALFVGGMILAEIDLIWKHVDQSSSRASRDAEAQSKSQSSALPTSGWARLLAISPASWLLAFIAGLFLLSVPGIEPVTAASYTWLADLLPNNRADKNRFVLPVKNWGRHIAMLVPRKLIPY